MAIGIESLFTSALGLSAPWRVENVNLDTALRRIDFDLTCDAKRLACPVCGLLDQGIHDRQKRQWRHLDFFQYPDGHPNSPTYGHVKLPHLN